MIQITLNFDMQPAFAWNKMLTFVNVCLCNFPCYRYPLHRETSLIYSQSESDTDGNGGRGGGLSQLPRSLNAERCRQYRKKLSGDKKETYKKLSFQNSCYKGRLLVRI